MNLFIRFLRALALTVSLAWLHASRAVFGMREIRKLGLGGYGHRSSNRAGSAHEKDHPDRAHSVVAWTRFDDGDGLGGQGVIRAGLGAGMYAGAVSATRLADGAYTPLITGEARNGLLQGGAQGHLASAPFKIVKGLITGPEPGA
ncbi:MAG: hypothetical protein AAGJ32_05895 [Pseudomonadota bacterium]